MITDGWVDWAIQAPGIPDKIYSERNRGIGLVGHSIVGSYQAALSRFLSTARDAEGRYTPNAAASVMFILCKNGDLVQMYDVWSSTWTSGGREANTSYWAIEAEGGPPSNPREPFTDEQVATLIRLFNEFETFTGRAVVRGTTFREHGELAAELGYASTACPSHRYDWFTGQEDDGMTDNDILAVFGSTEADPAERLANAKFRYQQAIDTGHSPYDIAAQAQAEARDHIKNHAAGVTGPVADHTHVEGKVKRS